MELVVVVDNPRTWRLKLPDVPVVSARSYLTDPRFSELRNVKVFNLCKSYAYQSDGYYVSLLAMARRHKPLPSITTIQDVKTLSITRAVADDLSDLITRSLKRLKSSRFVLSIYFGRNLAHRYEELSQALFRLFPVPLLSAEFTKHEGEWRVDGVRAMAAGEIPLGHVDFVEQSAQAFFARKRMPSTKRTPMPYDLAILQNPDEKFSPSNKAALRNFELACKRIGVDVEYIEKEDYARLPEFDALWIRETTAVNHHTYRFARRAAAEGLVVIDDPDSIVKCTNKVYLAELLTCNRIPVPKTLIVHEDNRHDVARLIGFPCILKQPDSSFSQGVEKVSSAAELDAALERLLKESDLIIAQEFMPTDFDWRIGVLDGQPLFAAKYHMAPQHWQIAKNGSDGSPTYGDVEALALDQVPPNVMTTALQAARLIGDGLYGVDLKQHNNQACIIEVNDNPTIMAGYEDTVAGMAIYERLAETFLKRIQALKQIHRSPVDAERELAVV